MSCKIGRALVLVLTLVASVVLAKGPAVLSADQVQPTGLTKDQAKQVLTVVLKHERYKLRMPGVFINGDLADEKGNPPHPGYFDFSLGYDSPKAGATEYMGLFSVSTATGDVWEINTCKHFAFPALRRLQSEITARTRKTMADEVAQRRGLGCTDD
jgi:hypothetical protein